MKKVIGIILGLILVLNLNASTIIAAEFRFVGEEENVTVPESEKVKNLYTGGNFVSINADVEKGLYVGGNVVTVDGDVGDHLIIGGSTVMIRGDVGGTIHAGGGSVVIEGAVTDDLFVGGGTVTISESASVGGDLIVGGGVVNILGPVEGDVLLGGGQVIINSSIGGSVKAEVESLELGKKAMINGDIAYKSNKEMTTVEGATVLGETEFTEVSKTEVYKAGGETLKSELLPGLVSMSLLVKLLASITTGLALVYFFNKWVQTLVKEAFANFWTNLGVGFATLASIPVVAIVLLITVVGASLAGLTGIIYILMLLLALPLGTIVLGSWLMKVLWNRDKYIADWKAVVLGVVAIKLLLLIPPIGWLVKLTFMLIGLGSLYRLTYKALVIKK